MSDRFPHANWFDPRELETTNLGGGAFNYIRNSVKITIDAYDGTTTFYVADPSDPIVRTYQKVFPTLFRPIDDLPETLQTHLRFPEELFNVQARMFGRYHVTSPQQFFRSDDLWTVPEGQTTEQTLPSEAYYVVMRMPGEAQAEFLLLQPMVPRNRTNMISWVAARMDPGVYGTTRSLRFPSDTNGVRSGPDRVPDRRGRHHQRADHAVEPGRQHGGPRQPHRDPGRRIDRLPPTVLPAIDRGRAARIPADRRRLAARGGLVADPRRRPALAARGRSGRRDPATGSRRVARTEPDADLIADRAARRIAGSRSSHCRTRSTS